MKPSSEIDVQRICEDMAEAMKPVVALLQQTREGVYFEGQEPGFADFVLVGLLAWFKRVNKRVWDAVTGYGKEIMAVWDGCKELLVQTGE
jgi:glutathione S-transferase